MTRQELFDWCRQQYGTEPDYPWNDWNVVLRHTDNNKWYGVVLEVDRRKLGLADEGIIDTSSILLQRTSMFTPLTRCLLTSPTIYLLPV